MSCEDQMPRCRNDISEMATSRLSSPFPYMICCRLEKLEGVNTMREEDQVAALQAAVEGQREAQALADGRVRGLMQELAVIKKADTQMVTPTPPPPNGPSLFREMGIRCKTSLQ